MKKLSTIQYLVKQQKSRIFKTPNARNDVEQQ